MNPAPSNVSGIGPLGTPATPATSKPPGRITGDAPLGTPITPINRQSGSITRTGPLGTPITPINQQFGRVAGDGPLGTPDTPTIQPVGVISSAGLQGTPRTPETEQQQQQQQQDVVQITPVRPTPPPPLPPRGQPQTSAVISPVVQTSPSLAAEITPVVESNEQDDAPMQQAQEQKTPVPLRAPSPARISPARVESPARISRPSSRQSAAGLSPQGPPDRTRQPDLELKEMKTAISEEGLFQIMDAFGDEFPPQAPLPFNPEYYDYRERNDTYDGRWPELEEPESQLNMDNIKGNKKGSDKEQVEYWKSVAVRLHEFLKILSINSYVNLYDKREDAGITNKLGDAPKMAKGILKTVLQVQSYKNYKKYVASLFDLDLSDPDLEDQVIDDDHGEDLFGFVTRLLLEYRSLLHVANATVVSTRKRLYPSFPDQKVPVDLYNMNDESKTSSSESKASYNVSTDPRVNEEWARELQTVAKNATALPDVDARPISVLYRPDRPYRMTYMRQYPFHQERRSYLILGLRDFCRGAIEIAPVLQHTDPSEPFDLTSLSKSMVKTIHKEVLPWRVLGTYPTKPLNSPLDQAVSRFRVWRYSFNLLNRFARADADQERDAAESLSSVFEKLATNEGKVFESASVLQEEKKWKELVRELVKESGLYSAQSIDVTLAEERKRFAAIDPAPTAGYIVYKDLTGAAVNIMRERMLALNSKLQSVNQIRLLLRIPSWDVAAWATAVQRLSAEVRIIKETTPIQRLVARELEAKLGDANGPAIRDKVRQMLTTADTVSSLQRQLASMEDVRAALASMAIDPANFNDFLGKFGKDAPEAIKKAIALKQQQDSIISYGQLCASITKQALANIGNLLQQTEVGFTTMLKIIRDFYVKYANEDVAKEVNRVSDMLIRMFTGHFQLVDLAPGEMIKVRSMPDDSGNFTEFNMITSLESVYRLASVTVVRRAYRQRWAQEEKVLGNNDTIDRLWGDLSKSVQQFSRVTTEIAESLVHNPRHAREIAPVNKLVDNAIKASQNFYQSWFNTQITLAQKFERDMSEMKIQVENESKSLTRDVNDRIANVLRTHQVKLMYSFINANLNNNLEFDRMEAPPTLWVDLSDFFVQLVAAFDSGRPTPEIEAIRLKLSNEIPQIRAKLIQATRERDEFKSAVNVKERQLVSVVRSHNQLSVDAQTSLITLVSKLTPITFDDKSDFDPAVIVNDAKDDRYLVDGSSVVSDLPDQMGLVLLNVAKYKRSVDMLARLLAEFAKQKVKASEQIARLEKKVQDARIKDGINRAVGGVIQPPLDAQGAAAAIAGGGNVLGGDGVGIENGAPAANAQGRGKSRGPYIRLPGIYNAGNNNRGGPGPNALQAAMDRNFVGQYDAPRTLKPVTITAIPRSGIHVTYEQVLAFMDEVVGATIGYPRAQFLQNPGIGMPIPSAAFLILLNYVEEVRSGTKSNQEVITRMLTTGMDIWWIEEQFVPGVVNGIVPETPPSPERPRHNGPVQLPSSIRSAAEQKRNNVAISPERMNPLDAAVDETPSLFKRKNVEGLVEVKDPVEVIDIRSASADDTPAGRRRPRLAADEDESPARNQGVRIEIPRARNPNPDQTPPRRVIQNPNLQLSPEEKKMRDGIDNAVQKIMATEMNAGPSVKEIALAVRKNFVRSMLSFIQFIAPLEQCTTVEEFDKLLCNYITPQPLQAMRRGLNVIRMRGHAYQDVSLHELMFSDNARLYFVGYIGAAMSEIGSMETQGYVQVHSKRELASKLNDAQSALEYFLKRKRPYSWVPSKDIVIENV